MSNEYGNGDVKPVNNEDNVLGKESLLIKTGANGTEFNKQHLDEDTVPMEDLGSDYNSDEHIDSATPSGLPVDRGWAWIILMASFINFGIVVGIYRTFGILFKEIQIKYGSSASQTALITSILNAGYSISSLLVTTIGMRYVSSRQLIIAGGVALSLSYILAAFAPNIASLTVLLGCCVGIAQGFIMCPTTTLLSYYFEKRRSFANAIALTGASLGTMMFSVIIRVLIEQYTFSGTMIILAGIGLHVVVLGCLMRPPSFYQRKVQDLVVENVDTKTEATPVANKECTNISMSAKYQFQNVAMKKQAASPLLYEQHSPLMARANMARRRRNRTTSEISKSSLAGVIGSTLSAISTSHIGRYASTELSYSSSIDIRESNTIVSKSNNKTLDNDVNVNNNGRTCCMCHSKFLGQMTSIMDCSVMKRIPFLTFLPCACLIATLSNVQIFLPPFAIDVGLSGRQSDTFITTISAVEIFSLVANGYFADKQIISRHKIVAIGACAISLATFCVPLFGTYALFMVFSVWFGMFSRVYFGLYPIVLIDFLGVENLGSAMGITGLVQTGFVAFLQPIIGLLRDNFQSYIPGFMFIATAQFCGALGMLTLPMAARFEQRITIKKQRDNSV